MKYQAKIIIAALVLVVIQPALSQSLVLTCYSKINKEYIENTPKFFSEMCQKFGREFCDKEREEKAKMRMCESSGLNYSHKREYIFEKNALSSSAENWAEVVSETCWGEVSKTRNKLKATPTVISFEMDRKNSFNLDRDTLSGGWGVDRKWDCSFREIKLKNKL